MIKLLPVLNIYEIEVENYKLLNDDVTYPVLLINNQYILKRVPSEVVVNEALFKINIKKELLKTVVLNKYDRVFTYYDSCFWLLTKYVKGIEFQHSKMEHLKLARNYLDNFKEKTPNIGEIIFHDTFSIEKWYEDSYEMMKKTFSLISLYYGTLEKEYCEKLMSIYNKLEFDYVQYGKLRKVLSHGEFQNTNILYNELKELNVIDWDSLAVRPFIFDLVSSACYLCRESRGDFILDSKKMEYYLGYAKVTKEEVSQIRNMIFLTFIPREDKLEKFYLSGQDKIKWYLNWTLDAMKKCLAQCE